MIGRVRSLAQVIGAGLDRTLAALQSSLGELVRGPARERVLAVLNGVLGDRLAANGYPLAITMQVRRGGKPVDLTPAGIAAAVPAASAKLLVLVHGLCMNDLQWERDGHDHGGALARDLSYSCLYLHYNSGLHVSVNGRQAAQLFEALVAGWPVPVQEFAIVSHSMGGLVVRSAVHYGAGAGHAWPGKLDSLVFLGVPHLGVPLERLGHWLELLLNKTPFTAPLAKAGTLRSAGITDLRFGLVLDEDWQGRDRFGEDGTVRPALALPADVRCYAIAAVLGKQGAPLSNDWLGDGLVPVDSALGRHANPALALLIPARRQWIAYGCGHLDLLGRADVYERIRGWLADPRSTGGSN